MFQYFIAYIATALFFLSVDLVWLSWVARGFYVEKIGGLLLAEPKIGAAAMFYLVYVVGILIFAVMPALKESSAQTALIYGALFGFFAYATYDMTNYATLRDWPLSMVVVDVIWGTILTGAAAFCGYVVTRAFV